MCGRFTLTQDLGYLAERFDFPLPEVEYRPAYNTAPTDRVLGVTHEGRRAAEMLRWGLVPSWAKDVKVGARMINARAEGVATSGAFRQSFRRRRCLVLADGFYEWVRSAGGRTAYRIGLKDWEPFAFAGLWSAWCSPDGDTVSSCSIITCPPNDLVAPIHDRMPVILSEADEGAWLDPALDDQGALLALLAPYPAEGMEAYRVSSAVNSVRNRGPECLAPA